jgi:hypothetical protein
MNCVNIKHPEFIALAKIAPVDTLELDFLVSEWMTTNNTTDRFPTLDELGLSNNKPIKPGVEELFESNPELANQVYEALGFKEKYQVGENAFDTVVNFDLNKIRSASGKLGEQGATPDGIRNLLKYVGVDLTNVNTESIKAMADYLKSNPLERAKVLELVKKEPIKLSQLPDGSYDLKDGNHRATILYYSGIESIPAIITDNTNAVKAKEEYIGPFGGISPTQETITPQQKQQALQQYSQYLDTGKQDIEGFKRFVNKDYFQKSNKGNTVTNEELNSKLRRFLSSIGISYKAVEEITDSQGNKLDVVARSNAFRKIIEVIEGKADLTTLPEEVAHIFVELMDQDSLLFKTMYNTINKYPIYQEVYNEYFDLYGGDINKIKKEAIGKLIVQAIIRQESISEDSKLNEKFNNWWSKIWNKIMSLFKGESFDAFNEAAKQILSGDSTGLKKSATEDQDYYQISNITAEQKRIKEALIETSNRLQKIFSIKDGKEIRDYFFDGKKTGLSVTEIIDKQTKGKYSKERTEAQKKSDLVFNKFGTLAHADFENIINRKLVGDTSVQKVISTTPESYKALEKWVDTFKDTFEPGSIFLSEVLVFDPKTNTPGTIDLVVIEPSGKTHIFDFKTSPFTKAEREIYGEPAAWKLEKYNLQLAKYTSILRNGYGITNFGKRRIVPIQTVFKGLREQNPKATGIKIGSADPKVSNKLEYLNQIPSIDEETGNEVIDKLIRQLKSIFEDLEKQKYADKSKYAIKKDRLTKIRKTIKELQLKKSFDHLIEVGNTELEYIQSRLDDKTNLMTALEIAEYTELINLYSNLSEIIIEFNKKETKDKIDPKEEKNLLSVEYKAKKIKSDLAERSKQVVLDAATGANVSDPFIPVKELGMATRLFKNINQINHPLFRILWDLVRKQKDKTKRAFDAKNAEIQKALDDLKKWSGESGINVFKHLIDDSKKKLISKYSKEFYTLKNKALENQDWEWIKNNTTYDEAKLEEYIKEQEKSIKAYKFSTDPAKNKTQIAQRISLMRESYDLKKHPQTAYLNKNNYFIRAQDKWISKEYAFIQANEPLKNFYDLFTNTIQEYKQYLPVDMSKLSTTFIPEVEETLIESIFLSGGPFSVANFGNRFEDMFKMKSESGFGQINEFTGEYDKKIPSYFIQEADRKSLDLGKSLSLFSYMALNYKHMSEIEGTIKNLQYGLKHSQEIATTGTGKTLKDKLKDTIKNKVVSLDTLESFNNFVDYYLYGIKTKDNWGTFSRETVNKETGEKEIKEYSWNKVATSALSYYSAKSLTLNLISGGANFFGGAANVIMQAARGNYFGRRQVLKSMQMISTGLLDDKTYPLIEFFDIMGESHTYQKAKALSVSKIVKNVDINKMYFLQKGGDWAIQNTVLLSMLQSHGLDANGKITSLKKMKEGSKSLLELTSLKDDKISIEGLSDEQYDIFRQKVQRLSENILGMSSRDNINGVRLSILGQAFMQFRNWIPRLAEERFGKITYDSDLETIMSGKYRTFAEHLLSKGALPLIKDLIVGFGPTSEARAREQWIKSLEKNPELKDVLTWEAYQEMYFGNLKATREELILILSFVGIFLFIKGSDDDDDSIVRKNLAKLWDRSISELTFFLIPTSFETLINKPLPIVGLVSNIFKLITHTYNQLFGYITDDEEQQKKAKPGKYVRRVFPLTSEIDKWFDFYKSEE